MKQGHEESADSLAERPSDGVSVKHKPATPLPFIVFDPQSGQIAKDWEQVPHGAVSNKLDREQKREIVRRANAYPRLVEFVRSRQGRTDADALLQDLGESA